MTQPIQPRPQPVVDIAGTLGGLAKGAFTAVFILANTIAVDGITPGNIGAVGNLIGLAVAAVGGLVVFVVSLFHARKAAKLVTPLSDPRNDRGEPLVDPDTYGRHAAPMATGGYVDSNAPRLSNDYVISRAQLEQVGTGFLDALNRTDTQEIPRVTEHPTRKLGKRPTDPNRPVLRMGAHLRVEAFTPPASVDYASRVNGWLLGSNDRFGTCGPTSVANLALLVSTLLADSPVRFTDDEIFDLYRRSGNPDFNPTTGAGDRGVDMTVMLAELVKNGIGFGDRNVKAVAFGSIDPHDTGKLWKAACLFGGVLWGSDLDVAQQQQTDAGLWDYKPSPSWGGHATLSAPSYSDQPGTLADRTKLVTWAELIAATDAFISRQVAECYVVLFPWHLGDKRIYQTLDMAGVAAEYEQLTGRPFPAPIQPPTPPTPTPPAPAPTPADFPLPQVQPWLDHLYTWSHIERNAKNAIKGWLNP